MHIISMDGPAMNAMGTDMMRHILSELQAAGDNPVLLTGAGRAFSAGLDLREVAALDRDGMETFLSLLVSLAKALFTHPAPTCAVVNGHAIAGGCILALCCDLRVATPSPKSRIGLNEVALGLCFPPSLLRLVLYRIPPGHRETVILGAGLHSPQDSLALGMLDAVEEDARAWGESRLTALAAHPRAAYSDAKNKLRAEAAAPRPDIDQAFLEDGLGAWTSPELKARLLAVLSKR
jgi:enoyl-CoA hydratase